MEKISAFTSTADDNGNFTNGSPASGISPTNLDAGWFNMVQAELISVLTAAGIAPDVANNAQLLAAMKVLFFTIAGGTLTGSLTAQDFLASTKNASGQVGGLLKLTNQSNEAQSSTELDFAFGAAIMASLAAAIAVDGSTFLSLSVSPSGDNTDRRTAGLTIDGSVKKTNSVFPLYENGSRVYSPNNLPSPADIGAAAVAGSASQSFQVAAGTNGNYAVNWTQLSAKANLTGGNTFTGDQNITGSLKASAYVYVGSALMQTDGNLSGSVWANSSNNYLSTYLLQQFATKANLQNGNTFTGTQNLTGALVVAGLTQLNGAATVTGNVTATGNLVGNFVHSTGDSNADGGMNAGGNITSNGVVQAYSAGNGTGTLYNDGNLSGRIWQNSNDVYLYSYLQQYFLQTGNLASSIINLGVGNVGTYALLHSLTGDYINPGDIVSGSNLAYSAAGEMYAATVSGSWRCHGFVNNHGGHDGDEVSLFLRVS